MKKTEVSVEGLRILRGEGELRLGEWATREAVGQPPSKEEDARRGPLREAVREANERLLKADTREGE